MGIKVRFSKAVSSGLALFPLKAMGVLPLTPMIEEFAQTLGAFEC